MQVFLDSKKEYVEHLLDLITIPLTKKIFKLYANTDSIKLFQDELLNIKKWNNNIIQEEYKELIKKIKCNYFDKLLKKIVILDVNIKTEYKYKIKDIILITPYDFIHKCLINIGIYCWKNVYLFSSKNLKPSEKQYHINIIEKNIRKIIKDTLRQIIPFETILADSSDEIIPKKSNIDKVKESKKEEKKDESEEEKEESEEENEESEEEDEEEKEEENEESEDEKEESEEELKSDDSEEEEEEKEELKSDESEEEDEEDEEEKEELKSKEEDENIKNKKMTNYKNIKIEKQDDEFYKEDESIKKQQNIDIIKETEENVFNIKEEEINIEEQEKKENLQDNKAEKEEIIDEKNENNTEEIIDKNTIKEISKEDRLDDIRIIEIDTIEPKIVKKKKEKLKFKNNTNEDDEYIDTNETQYKKKEKNKKILEYLSSSSESEDSESENIYKKKLNIKRDRYYS